MIVNWSLLQDIANFNPDDPDIDQAFIDALLLYYFPMSTEVGEKILDLIGKKPKGVDVLIALGLRMAQEKAKATGTIDKFAKDVMQAYNLNESGKTSTTKEVYFVFLGVLLDFGLIENEKGIIS